MKPTKYVVLLESEDYDPNDIRGRRIVIGRIELTYVQGPAWSLAMPELPDLLKALAESHEDAVTSGPPEGWLE